MEKSNTLLEERNEGYKLTANQSQSRILALEQEKVRTVLLLFSFCCYVMMIRKKQLSTFRCNNDKEETVEHVQIFMSTKHSDVIMIRKKQLSTFRFSCQLNMPIIRPEGFEPAPLDLKLIHCSFWL